MAEIASDFEIRKTSHQDENQHGGENDGGAKFKAF